MREIEYINNLYNERRENTSCPYKKKVFRNTTVETLNSDIIVGTVNSDVIIGSINCMTCENYIGMIIRKKKQKISRNIFLCSGDEEKGNVTYKLLLTERKELYTRQTQNL
jgi:hypothetical protein